MLDSRTISIGWGKIASFVPITLTYMLITYIGRLFLQFYLEEKLYVDEPYCAGAIICRIIFCFFIVMTYIFLTLTFFLNPGYLPKWLRAPAIDPTAQPLRLLRVFNLRLLLANKIITCEEFLERDDSEQ